jgi:hypothetical protein
MISVGDRVQFRNRPGVVTHIFDHPRFTPVVRVAYDKPYVDPVQGLIKHVVCMVTLVEKMETGT